MSTLPSLDQFRNEWKKELAGKKRTSSDITDNEGHVLGVDNVSQGPALPSGSGSDGATGSGSSLDDIVNSHKEISVHRVATKNQDPGLLDEYLSPEAQAGYMFQSFEVAKRTSNTLQPFLLTENLLRESGSDYHMGVKRTFSPRPNKRPRVNTGPVLENNKKETFLDIFLADLDEINEIPFFDIELPRELALKIFKYFDYKDLCRCAQVSVAWKSLAEDELLWCRVAQSMGYEQQASAIEKSNWKSFVKGRVEKENFLNNNWRNRTGAIFRLEYPRGGVLCAGASHGSNIVAGYTNGDVKFWNVQNNEECIFRPSSTALILDERQDEMGTIHNYVTNVATNDSITIAGYKHGNVDVWSNKEGTEAIHSIKGPPSVSHLCLAPDKNIIAAAYGRNSDCLRVEYETEEGVYTQLQTMEVPYGVSGLLFVPRWSSNCDFSNLLVVSSGDCIKSHVPGTDQSDARLVHHVIDQTVMCMDYRANQLAYSIKSTGGPLTSLFQVKFTDLENNHEILSLRRFNSTVLCMNVRNSPDNMLVTGCSDKSVMVNDVRLEEPIMCFRGHSGYITWCQMDDWKVVSGGSEGLICVWDQRMGNKLWEFHNRHRVDYLHFDKGLLVTANIPAIKFPDKDRADDGMHALRYRGNIQVYNFAHNQLTDGVPTICYSTYDEPEAYNYNIRLAVPYDQI